MPDPSASPSLDGAPRKYAWPKYVLAAVSLFFLVCIVWTVKEVTRLKRAKTGGMESPRVTQTTN